MACKNRYDYTHKKTLSKHNHCWLLVWCLVGLNLGAQALGDFAFDIDQKYMVVRASGKDIRLVEKKGDGSIDFPLESEHLTPVYALSVSDRFIIAWYASLSDDPNTPETIEKDGNTFAIIDRKTDEAHGPLDKNTLRQFLDERGVARPLRWQTLENAFHQALREGRADKLDVDAAMVGVAIMIVFLFVMYFLPFSIPVALLVGWILSRWKKQPFTRMVLWTELVLSLAALVYLFSYPIYHWVYFRFF